MIGCAARVARLTHAPQQPIVDAACAAPPVPITAPGVGYLLQQL